MKIKKHILIPLMVLLLFGSMDAMAAIEQAIQVKGKVVDNIGEPVIGANVVVKGTTTNQKKMSYLFYKYLFSIPKYSLLQMVYLN